MHEPTLQSWIDQMAHSITAFAEPLGPAGRAQLLLRVVKAVNDGAVRAGLHPLPEQPPLSRREWCSL